MNTSLPPLPDDNKRFQLRVRVTAEEHGFLEKLRAERDRGETISDLVREALGLLSAKNRSPLEALEENPSLKSKLFRLAELLNREPQQIEQACVEGIFDIIENKAKIPLIVMETQLHLSYRGQNEAFPWDEPAQS